jgi:hypothetical protein
MQDSSLQRLSNFHLSAPSGAESSQRGAKPAPQKRRPGVAVALAAIAAVALLAPGCIVTTNGGGFGTIEVQWAVPGGCASQGIATVRVRTTRGSIVDAEISGISCQKGFQSLTVSPGVHIVTIEGISNGGSIIAAASINNVVVDANLTTTTPIAQLTSQSALGTIQLSWTINGSSAVSACNAAGLSKVLITLFDSSKTKVVATGEANCSSAGANLIGVPSGTGYLQLDGLNANGTATFGNAALEGPIQVQAAATTFLDTPINLVALASVVSLDWQFQDGGTCGSHGSNQVLVEVSNLDNGAKVVVPMSDPDASKPCDIGQNSAYEARTIDLQFSPATCVIPAGAKGLVICGITGSAIGVRISVVDAATNTILYGGSMTIEKIPVASHAPIAVPLYLAPCNTTDNICGAP